jgi:hypothetical protein
MFVVLTHTFTACATFINFIGLDLTTGERRQEVRASEGDVRRTMKKYGFVYSCPPNLFVEFIRKANFCRQIDVLTVMDKEHRTIVTYDVNALKKCLGLDVTYIVDTISCVLLATYVCQLDFSMRSCTSVIAVFNSMFPDTRTGKTEAQGSGGFVLDTVPGLYVDVVEIDVDSMYPSIMVHYNTVAVGPCAQEVLAFLQQGLAIKKYVEGIPHLRRLVKFLLNALYGAYRCPAFHLYCPAVAEKTCRLGRKMLHRMKFLAHQDGQVVYGVTDSVYVCGVHDIDLVEKFKEEFPAFSFSVEVYESMVIVAKNHYVALKKNDEILHRGTVFRRKNVTQLEKTLFDGILRSALVMARKKELDVDVLYDMGQMMDDATLRLSTTERERVKTNLKQILQYTGHESLVSLI